MTVTDSRDPVPRCQNRAMTELTPYPLRGLVARALKELERNDSIFDLPRRKFWFGDPGHDTTVEIHGRRVTSPLGPSAGPHTQ
ncbi:MAG TPA: hypothetical protein VIL97_10330, partial [Thermoanaerobaculia bacterium]